MKINHKSYLDPSALRLRLIAQDDPAERGHFFINHVRNVKTLDNTNDDKIKAKNVLTKIFGTIKPANFNPTNVNELIDIFEIKTVRRYRIITFIKKENVPKVIKFRGRVMILKMGLIITNIKDNAIPPIIKVGMPPLIFTPGNTRVSIKRLKE